MGRGRVPLGCVCRNLGTPTTPSPISGATQLKYCILGKSRARAGTFSHRDSTNRTLPNITSLNARRRRYAAWSLVVYHTLVKCCHSGGILYTRTSKYILHPASFRVHRPRRAFIGAALGSSTGGTMGSSAPLVAHLLNNPVRLVVRLGVVRFVAVNSPALRNFPIAAQAVK